MANKVLCCFKCVLHCPTAVILVDICIAPQVNPCSAGLQSHCAPACLPMFKSCADLATPFVLHTAPCSKGAQSSARGAWQSAFVLFECSCVVSCCMVPSVLVSRVCRVNRILGAVIKHAGADMHAVLALSRTLATGSTVVSIAHEMCS